MEAVTAENTNLKVQLQIKEELVAALKLKLDNSSNTSVETTELHDEGYMRTEEVALPRGE